MNKYGDIMKTQNEFLEALEEELRFLKAKEIHEILKHYRDKINSEIDYGTPEEKIISNLPLPKDIANDIYKARGISFLEIQKKKYRQKEIANAILSGFIISLMLVLFVSIVSFFGYTIVGFNKLLTGLSFFNSSLDQVLVVLLVLMLDIAMLAIFVFVIDLFYIIISHFLVNILKAIKKTYRVHYKFQDFSISGSLKNKAKNKNVIAIALAGSATLALIIFGASLFTKGYIYRSFNDLPLNVVEKQYNDNIKDINITGTNANIRFEVNEELDDIKVEYKYEFNDKIDINIDEFTLNIKNIGSKSFGLFGLLDEPSPIVVITLPSAEYIKNINVQLDQGSLYLKKVLNIGLSVNVDIYNSEVYIEDSNLKALTVDSYKTNIKIANLDNKQEYYRINNLKIETSTGSFAMEGISVNEFNYENVSTKTVIKRCQINTFNFKTDNGNTVFYEVEGKKINYITRSANNILDDIEYANASFEANRASSITITRLMVEGDLSLTSYTGGIITISRLKAKTTYLGKEDSPLTGNIILNYINQDDILTEKDTEELVVSKTTYNDFNVSNTKIVGYSEGAIYINRSIIENINLKQTSSALQVSDTNIKGYAMFNVDSAKNLTFTDVIGTDIHFVVKHTKIVYYNSDNNLLNTKFYVKYEGASYGCDSNIKPEVEPNE